ncbi:alpha/beta fold hydrolase [Companilactobacillus versmoldensis]|uniref:Alpha beta hydrolase fold protein n=1 Tax=Companilactobacillus versmoldensis DSM 14857 = KCTC 3814 TaxID=1423815 RepID=A0A0R1SMG0_9LACO|nr:alpha/beta hydrolase [Companilactobacillus versmoldensis]KRL67224.1 alpha beta hydrolase fold protein [Companilactobacillus versmoldensis DSM 14857 = KCTC 3814]
MVVEKYVKTSKLQMSYEVSGPENGRPLILLHGWPDCVRTFDEVLPHLHNCGYKTYVPSLRGFGNTSFLDSEARKTGGPIAIAEDIKEMIDILELAPVDIIGQDWGALAAMALSSLYGSKLVKSEVVLSAAWQLPGHMSLDQIKNNWYQWFMATQAGADYIRKRQSEIALYLWKEWSPGFQMTAQKARTLTSYFQNEDWAEVTLDTYRTRWGIKRPDKEYADMRQRLMQSAQIKVPTLSIIGKEDRCVDQTAADQMQKYFEAPFKQQFWNNAGHFIQREQPREIAYAATDWLGQTQLVAGK